MKKLRNPYENSEGYFCFGCSNRNSAGLKMEFYEDHDDVVSEWIPEKSFQGYKNVLHGGIQVTLMDEIASWFVNVKLGTAGVTSKIETKFIKPVFITDAKIFLKASLIKMMRNIAVIDAKLYNADKDLCSESVVYYFTFDAETASKKFFYPGKNDFYL